MTAGLEEKIAGNEDEGIGRGGLRILLKMLFRPSVRPWHYCCTRPFDYGQSRGKDKFCKVALLGCADLCVAQTIVAFRMHNTPHATGSK